MPRGAFGSAAVVRQRLGLTRGKAPAKPSGGETTAPGTSTRQPTRQHRAWQRVRAERLRIEPSCRTCRAEGGTTTATEVDHVVPISEGGALLDLANTQSLCAEHHADKSAADRARRTGRPVCRRRRYGVDAATGRPLDPNHWWNAGK
jgi:5-methylcytosine-specific restriction protein A